MSISRLSHQPGAAGIVRRPLSDRSSSQITGKSSIYAFFTTSRDNLHDRGVAGYARTKTLTADVQRMNAERQLFSARRALGHLVELYESGQWKSLYKEDAFAEAVRQAREAVDRWADVVSKTPEA